MSAAKKALDHKLLRSLSPLCDLTPDMLTELSAKSRVEHVVSGATIFRAGERDHRTLYLVSGKLELTDAMGKSSRIAANSKQAQEPLDPNKPRTMTATAKSAVTLLNIDTELLDMLLNWSSSSSYEVSDIEGEEEEETDWMSRFLQSKVFLKLRAENIQAMLMRMEVVEAKAGQVIIREGDSDDNYFIIAKGSVKVGRQGGPDGKPTKLATFTAGSGFGEEALIANGQRNASVIMQEDGELMKLGKEDFINLLVNPVLETIAYDSACEMQGPDVQWLDVREPEEFVRGALPEAMNIPLPQLRPGLRKLNKLHKYIICSNQENRARAAAFLLSQQGLDAYVLNGGLVALPESALTNRSEPEQIPEAQSNVVALHPDEDALQTEQAERSEAMMDKARQRVQEEMRRAQMAENARQLAQEEVARLKAEAEALRQEQEVEAQKSTAITISEEEQQVIQERLETLARQTAEREEAVLRAEAEASRAEVAEAAREEAESEIERLTQKSAQTRREAEEHARQISEAAKQDAENQIIRLKAEAEFSRQQAQEQAQFAADAARTEAEREQARQLAEASANHQQEIEEALHKAEAEAERAQQAEEARRAAEEEAQRMREKAEETQHEMEEQVRLAADQARSEAEREAARSRAEELACKQEEIEAAVSQAEALVVRAELAEEEVYRLKQQAEEARQQAEEQARLAVDQARTEVEREMARQRAEEMASLQIEREATLLRAEEEALRAKAAEEARIKAESEIQRFKVDAEVARMQVEEQAQRIADVARSETEREAARARAAEAARLQAEDELERLELRVEEARLEAEEQARLAVDQARSEVEREAARLRAEELASQQAQLEESARRAEKESVRAQKADEARQRAEREIVQRQMEVEEAEQRAETAEQARREMEAEMARLREAAQSAQQSTGKQDEDQEEQQVREQAVSARAEAEEIRNKANEDIVHLKMEAEAARMNAEVEVKRTIASARNDDVDMQKLQQRANARARQNAARNADKSLRQREAREEALRALGDEGDSLGEFLGESIAENEINIDEAEIATLGKDRENLIDPREPVEGTTPQENKQWLSDDFLWQETLGLRRESGPGQAAPAEEPLEAQKNDPKQAAKTDKSTARTATEAVAPVSDTVSSFKIKEVDHRIRPQSVKPLGYVVQTGSKRWIVVLAAMALVAASAGGWVYTQGQDNATRQAKEFGAQALGLFDQVRIMASAQMDSWFGESAEQKAASNEEKMARLRERLNQIKAQAEQEKRQQQALEAARLKVQQEAEKVRAVQQSAEVEKRPAPGSFEERLSVQSVTKDSEIDFEKRLEAQNIGSGETLTESIDTKADGPNGDDARDADISTEMINDASTETAPAEVPDVSAPITEDAGRQTSDTLEEMPGEEIPAGDALLEEPVDLTTNSDNSGL